jgi:cell wall-associated NlpC family hydrolase
MMRKTSIVIASVLASVLFASSVSAAVQYETEVTYGVNFRDKPSATGYKYRMLPKGEDIHVIEKISSYWLKIQVQDGTIGYISADAKYTDFRGTISSGSNSSGTTPSASTSDLRENLAEKAKTYIGVFSYKWGAEPWTTNYRYTDCSAFTKLVFKDLGIDIPRSSRDQSKAGSFVSKSNLRVGDLLFFDTNGDGTINHVGMYIGNNQFIHATPSINGVGINSISTGYWSTHYVTARDVLR